MSPSDALTLSTGSLSDLSGVDTLSTSIGGGQFQEPANYVGQPESGVYSHISKSGASSISTDGISDSLRARTSYESTSSVSLREPSETSIELKDATPLNLEMSAATTLLCLATIITAIVFPPATIGIAPFFIASWAMDLSINNPVGKMDAKPYDPANYMPPEQINPFDPIVPNALRDADINLPGDHFWNSDYDQYDFHS